MHDRIARLQLREWRPFSSVYALVLLAALGIGARVWLAVYTFGTNDVDTWQRFATLIDQHGVAYLYRNDDLFNHPPLMGYLAVACWRVSRAAALPFSTVFKLPMVGADIVSALVLWNIVAPRRGPHVAALAVAAYAWSLLSILITGYHGNTDSLCALFCLLAAYLIDRRLPLAAGLALAAALNVKLIPLVLVPAYALAWRSWRDRLRFGAGLALAVVPFLQFTACCGGDVYRNALAYNSSVELWGIMLLVELGANNAAFAAPLHRAGELYVAGGRYVIIGCVVLASLWSRWKAGWSPYQLGAVCFGIFLVLAPGFGVQYLIYICPLLFAVNLGWAAGYSLLAGTFAGLLYYGFWDHTLPFRSHFSGAFPAPAPLFGLLVWILLLVFVVQQLPRSSGSPGAASTTAWGSRFSRQNAK